VRKPMAKSKLTHKKTQLLNQNGSAIGSVIDILRGQLAQLEEEIKADKAGVKAYRAQLKLLHAKKHQAEKRLAANQDWAAQFDRDIGPFEKKCGWLVWPSAVVNRVPCWLTSMALCPQVPHTDA